MMMTSKSQNYECCMCGDHGLSYELFRCKVCHFRSQHRYCSNLYPKAESYRVCNWCLIQKDDDEEDDDHDNFVTTTTTTTSNNNSSNSTSPIRDQSKTMTMSKKLNGPPKPGGSPKCLHPITSPIKKPIRSPEARSPSGRKRITAGNCLSQEERLRRTKSEEISNHSTTSSVRSSGGGGGGGASGGGGGGGPAVIKHVFRNKVRRYKLLDEVSS